MLKLLSRICRMRFLNMKILTSETTGAIAARPA